MKRCFALVLMSLFAIRAHADWSSSVTLLEGTVDCDGLTADLMSDPSVNVAAGTYGEFRVAPGIFSLQGTLIYFTSNDNWGEAPAVEVGSLVSIPVCSISDSGDAPSASWVEINLDPGVSAQISSSQDSYRMTITLANGSVVSAAWHP